MGKRLEFSQFVCTSDDDERDERLLILDDGDVGEDDDDDDDDEDKDTRRVCVDGCEFESRVGKVNEGSSASNVNGDESVNGDMCCMDCNSGSVLLP